MHAVKQVRWVVLEYRLDVFDLDPLSIYVKGVIGKFGRRMDGKRVWAPVLFGHLEDALGLGDMDIVVRDVEVQETLVVGEHGLINLK